MGRPHVGRDAKDLGGLLGGRRGHPEGGAKDGGGYGLGRPREAPPARLTLPGSSFRLTTRCHLFLTSCERKDEPPSARGVPGVREGSKRRATQPTPHPGHRHRQRAQPQGGGDLARQRSPWKGPDGSSPASQAQSQGGSSDHDGVTTQREELVTAASEQSGEQLPFLAPPFSRPRRLSLADAPSTPDRRGKDGHAHEPGPAHRLTWAPSFPFRLAGASAARGRTFTAPRTPGPAVGDCRRAGEKGTP